MSVKESAPREGDALAGVPDARGDHSPVARDQSSGRRQARSYNLIRDEMSWKLVDHQLHSRFASLFLSARSGHHR